MPYENHLYMVLHPNHALIASQLDAAAFAKHYVQGSTRYFEGRLLFIELDPAFRHPFFDIDGAYAQLIPHEDGSPKATKFIKSYRVLEHVDFKALGTLYFANAMGEYVELEPAAYDPAGRGDRMRIILEIDPLRMMVLTRFNFLEFAAFITDPAQAKGAPAMFYTQLDFSVDDFLAEFSENPFVRARVPGIHPARLREAILEVERSPGKNTKGLSLDCPFDRVSYKALRRGFMFAGPGGNRFYPLMPIEEVEKKHHMFWKTM